MAATHTPRQFCIVRLSVLSAVSRVTKVHAIILHSAEYCALENIIFKNLVKVILYHKR